VSFGFRGLTGARAVLLVSREQQQQEGAEVTRVQQQQQRQPAAPANQPAAHLPGDEVDEGQQQVDVPYEQPGV